MEIKLKYPLVLHEDGVIKTINTVVMADRMQMKHLRQIPDSVIEELKTGAGSISGGSLVLRVALGLSELEFDEIDANEDMPMLMEHLPSFLGQAAP